MVKIVAYDTLIPEIADIQPSIAWLLANVTGSDRVTKNLENLLLKFTRLQGKILELEVSAVVLEEGSITVVLPEEAGDDLAYAEDALRTQLAEVIVRRGEEQLDRYNLEKTARYAELYGCNPCDELFLDQDGDFVEHTTSIQSAIEQTRLQREDDEALEAVKATVAALGVDEVPDIDLDGQLLN